MTARKRLLITRKLQDAIEQRAARDYDVTLNPDDIPVDGDRIVELAQGMDAILCAATEKFSAEVIAGLPDSVQILVTFSVGYDHIDVAAARARGLVVANTPDVLSDATADTVMLLLLGAARHAHEGQMMLRTGNWPGWNPTQMVGVQASFKRLGIVGMGGIGRAMAARARGLGMQIHYQNRNRLPPELEGAATYHASLDEMLPEVDFLSLHCPATAENRGMIDERRLALLPRGAIIVNTARGSLVDDEALLAALDSGHIYAAGLDVFDGEPDVHPGYLGRNDCYILPHMGSGTIETRHAMGFRALDNIDAHFAGATPPDRL
ncbi:MAG: D-glycerate dehydrogenase [Rhodospirillales bacterium]